MTSTATQYEVGTIVHVAPGTLLMERNIRDAKPDKALVDSIRTIGVQEPISAVITAAGELLVRLGHRRTLGAIEAERETVPVYVVGHDSDAKTDEILRVIAQRDENTHRAGLTTAEEIGVVETLTGLGLSAAQVAKQARMKRADVDNAITVSGSALTRKAADRYETLTLDQLVTVQEFEDDAETVKALIVAATEGKFDHVAQRARNDRDEAAAKAQVIAVIEAEGVTVIERPGHSAPAKALRNIKANDEATEALSVETHAECPGHVAWIENNWVTVTSDGSEVEYPDEPGDDADEEAWDAYEAEYERVRLDSRNVQRPTACYGCADPTANGHVDRWGGGSSTSSKPKAADMSEEEREAAKAKRALVVENNKAWTAAQPVRREFLHSFAGRKTAPKGAAAFIATALSVDASIAGKGSDLAAEWLGVKKTGWRTDLTPAKTATDSRALVVVLTQVLASYEAETTGDGAWRQDGTGNSTGRYLRYLASLGYTLADVEEFAASKKTA
jgi:ParB family chromosome partitioning protein